jgi:hypothetical protein
MNLCVNFRISLIDFKSLQYVSYGYNYVCVSSLLTDINNHFIL